VSSIEVEMAGTDANGSAGSARATVNISTCQGAMPQTGGGAALLGLVALGGFTALARRRR
jgi:MYXO-CTERM domain-containing protein